MTNMPRILAILAGLAVLGVDFAALDDITTGNEPSFFGEWFFVVVSVPLLAVLTRLAFRDWSSQPR